MNIEEITRTPIRVNVNELIIGNDLIVTNDKVASQLFNCEKAEWEKLFNENAKIIVMEKEPRTIFTGNNEHKTVSKPLAQVTVKVRIKPDTDEVLKQKIISSPLNNFDKLVLDACCTHQYAGKKYITIRTLFKYLGYTGNLKITQKTYINESIDKLRCIEVKMDVTESYTNLKRLQNPDGTPIRKFKMKPKKSTFDDYYDELDGIPSQREQPKLIISGALLPASVWKAIVNGVSITAIEFSSPSPIFIYASDKGETTKLNHKVFHSSGLNNTQVIACMKIYIANRIKSMSRSTRGGGKSLEPIIIFQSLYNHCAINEKLKSNRMFKKRLRENAYKYLTFLKSKRHIKDFVCLDKFNKEQSDLAKCVKFRIIF